MALRQFVCGLTFHQVVEVAVVGALVFDHVPVLRDGHGLQAARVGAKSRRRNKIEQSRTQPMREMSRRRAETHRHVTAREEVVGGQLKVELVPVALEGSGVRGRDEVGGGRAQLREEQTVFGWMITHINQDPEALTLPSPLCLHRCSPSLSIKQPTAYVV